MIEMERDDCNVVGGCKRRNNGRPRQTKKLLNHFLY